MDRGAWWVTVHKVTKSQTRLKQFSTHTAHTQSGANTRASDSLVPSNPPGPHRPLVTLITSSFTEIMGNIILMPFTCF